MTTGKREQRKKQSSGVSAYAEETLKTKKLRKEIPPLHFGYLKDGHRYRVWRSDWSSDQFELLSLAEFEAFVVWAARFSFRVRDIND